MDGRSTSSPAPPQAAYGAVARADGPSARWIIQGWMLKIKGSGFGPPAIGPLALSRLRAFAAAGT